MTKHATNNHTHNLYGIITLFSEIICLIGFIGYAFLSEVSPGKLIRKVQTRKENTIVLILVKLEENQNPPLPCKLPERKKEEWRSPPGMISISIELNLFGIYHCSINKQENS